MAYMNQQMKKQLLPGIKSVLKKFNVKGTVSVENYSTLNVNITSGSLDLDQYNGKNYCVSFADSCERKDSRGEQFFTKLLHAMSHAEGLNNFDKSDPMTDYFHIGWFTNVNVGTWKKSYQIAA